MKSSASWRRRGARRLREGTLGIPNDTVSEGKSGGKFPREGFTRRGFGRWKERKIPRMGDLPRVSEETATAKGVFLHGHPCFGSASQKSSSWKMPVTDMYREGFLARVPSKRTSMPRGTCQLDASCYPVHDCIICLHSICVPIGPLQRNAQGPTACMKSSPVAAGCRRTMHAEPRRCGRSNLSPSTYS